MTQPDLFYGGRRQHKRVNVPHSSVEAYQTLSPQTRMAEVVRRLERCAGVFTSAELADFGGDLAHLLYIRRGLSDALAAGLVEHAGKRICTVSGRLALTWRVVSR